MNVLNEVSELGYAEDWAGLAEYVRSLPRRPLENLFARLADIHEYGSRNATAWKIISVVSQRLARLMEEEAEARNSHLTSAGRFGFHRTYEH
jgi:hypothetical protein